MQIAHAQAVLTNGIVMTGDQFFCNIIYCTNPVSKLYLLKKVPLDHNVFDDNVVFHNNLPLLIDQGQTNVVIPPPDQWDAWKSLGEDQHSAVADPHFVDASKDDYRLQADSPAYKLGFKAIPIKKIGPYADELRATWYIVEAESIREHQ